MWCSKYNNNLTMGKCSKCNCLYGRFPLLPLRISIHSALLPWVIYFIHYLRKSPCVVLCIWPHPVRIYPVSTVFLTHPKLVMSCTYLTDTAVCSRGRGANGLQEHCAQLSAKHASLKSILKEMSTLQPRSHWPRLAKLCIYDMCLFTLCVCCACHCWIVLHVNVLALPLL